MKKLYALGVLVGRFQTIHTGHEMMINTASELCERVALFIGSSNESRTNKNPFTYEERKETAELIFGKSIEVYPLPDIGVGNNPKWGEYVLLNVKKQTSVLPDLIVSGKEGRRSSWFEGEEADRIAELYIPKTIEISATQMRKFIIDNNFDEWKKFSNPKQWDRFSFMREIILQSKDNTDTKSL